MLARSQRIVTSNEGSHAIKAEQLFSKHTYSERKKMLKIWRYFLQQDSSLKIRLTYPASLYISSGHGFSKYTFDEKDLIEAENYFQMKRDRVQQRETQDSCTSI